MTGVFVTGTDTGCGKTYFTTALLSGLNDLGMKVTGMKPVATGSTNHDLLENEDISKIVEASNTNSPDALVNQYLFREPCSPNIASALSDTKIEISGVINSFAILESQVDFVIVEGVGGWQVPLNKTETIADLATALGIPVILVVGMKLGCINHAILTAAAMERYNVRVLGWVANFLDPDLIRAREVLETLVCRLSIPLLFELSKGMVSENRKQLAQHILAAIGDAN